MARSRAQTTGQHKHWRRSKFWLDVTTIIAPKLVAPYACRADCHHAFGEEDAAVAECEKGIQIDPNDIGCNDRRVAHYWRVGDRDRAIELRAEIVRKFPDNVEVLFAYGHTCGYADRDDEAIECFRKVLTFASLSARQKATANHNLALYLGIQGKDGDRKKTEEALMALDESKRADPTWEGHTREKMYKEFQGRLEWHERNDFDSGSAGT